MKSITLNNWKFHYKDCPDAWYKGFLDDSWEEVTVPHDWSVHMPFSKEYSSGTGYLAGGIGWYRTSFFLPEALKGKKIFVEFDGVYKNSQVWCNSYYLGKRPFGYSSFRYDITNQACFGDIPNLIAVKVDHQDIADSRWFTGSGITRKVTIVVDELVHYDYNGSFFQTPFVSTDRADIEIANTIVNDSKVDVTIKVDHQFSIDGQDTFHMEDTCYIPAMGTLTLGTKGTLLSPTLWSSDSPNLYDLTTIISSQSVDNSFHCSKETFQKVGIRNIHFDSDKGFYINGLPMKLKGVCIHHDAGCLGAAVLPEVWLRRLCKLKEMGCNSIRMSHNPHMPELYDLCDSLGFLVIDEAFDEWEGAKNKWSIGHNVWPPKHQGYFEDFPEWHERDLSDLIKRDRNHASIIMWSIGNEIDYPNDPYCHPLFSSMTGNNDKNKPAAEREYNYNKPNAERLTVIANQLSKIVKNYDTTRPVSAAVAFPELSTQLGFIDSFDVVGYNYKEHLYADDHKRFPDKPFLGSENSHSYKDWKAVRDCDYISGQFLWTGIDYLGEALGWPVRGSGAGILTLAGYPKASYYRRQSFWLDTPVIYLSTARADMDEHGALLDTKEEWKTMYRIWNYLPCELTEVRCYTNLPYAELSCNGQNLGRKQFDDSLGYITWFVPFETGELKVLGYNSLSDAKEVAQDIVVSTACACDIQLALWNSLESLKDNFPNYACQNANEIKISDSNASIKQIEVTVTDGLGRRVTADSTMLSVNVSGSGKLIGLENGDLSDCTEYTLSERRAYEGQLLIYIQDTNTEGTTTISVSGLGLRTALISC